jgi:hypothetical protein
MADEEIVKPLPYVAFPVVLSQIDRMGGNEGIPGKLDKKYLVGMAEGTQFQYRQGFRYLGLTTNDDQPTPLLADLVRANQTDRRELFGKIMSTRWPDVTGLPSDASKDDFFAVLQDRYGVTSDVQRRKMLTFFVAAADYAGLRISPDIRPAKLGTGSRKPRGRRRTSRQASRPAKPAIHTPEAHADPGGQEVNTMPAERQDISLGDAGSVSVIVNVARWWDLSDDQFTKLRKLIKDIEALGDSGS